MLDILDFHFVISLLTILFSTFFKEEKNSPSHPGGDMIDSLASVLLERRTILIARPHPSLVGHT